MNDFAIRILTAPKGQTHLFYAGQAGFIVKNKEGKTLAIDLYLSDCGERLEGNIGFKRLLPKILCAEELSFDTIIATHPHFDHYDVDAMPILMSNPTSYLFASTECKRFVQDSKIIEDRVTYVKPKESYECNGFVFHFIDCDHGKLAPDAVGVIIEVDGLRIMVAGDTCLRLDWREEYLAKGQLDVLIAPINGQFGNLSEEECASLSMALKPHLTIPCHYGLFARHMGLPGLFMEKMAEMCPEQKYLLMTMGESIQL